MQKKGRLGTLIFDEMAILTHVQYNELEDRLDGIQNGEPVDHVLVCMIKGIRKKLETTDIVCIFQWSDEVVAVEDIIENSNTRITSNWYIQYISPK